MLLRSERQLPDVPLADPYVQFSRIVKLLWVTCSVEHQVSFGLIRGGVICTLLSTLYPFSKRHFQLYLAFMEVHKAFDYTGCWDVPMI